MKPELMKRHIRLPTAAAIWRTLKTAFVDEKNGVKIYTLNQKAFRLRQNGRPISIFFGELYEIFQELDHYNTIAMICEKDVKIYQELQEQQRVYIFLGGLDDEFEQIRGEILRKDPLPGLQTSYAYVRREYDRKIAMKNEADHAEAMVARNHIPQRHGERFGSDRMSRNKCAHCGRPGHSKQKCFELIGYPEGWDKTRDPRHGKPRASIAETKNFLRTGKEELNLVAEHAADDQSIALIAASGHEGKALPTCNSVSNSDWVIDSGATSHMTNDSDCLQYIHKSSQLDVTTANGGTAQIIGEGPVELTNTLNLDTVLVVPSLGYNLLSIAQITIALSCLVIFCPNLCVFQDIQTGG